MPDSVECEHFHHSNIQNGSKSLQETLEKLHENVEHYWIFGCRSTNFSTGETAKLSFEKRIA